MNSDSSNGNNPSYIGFSLDSLLKLQSSKAYDNKTTILDYVIQLIYKNDSSCLDFPSEIENLQLASRLSIDQIQSERGLLRKGYEDFCNVYDKLKKEDLTNNLSIDLDKKTSIELFVEKAGKVLDELDTLLDDKVKASYSQLLNYFGEDQSMQSNEFFFTLLKFTQEFINTRDVIERTKRLEEKRRIQQEKQSVNPGKSNVPTLTKKASKRHNSLHGEVLSASPQGETNSTDIPKIEVTGNESPLDRRNSLA